MIGTRSRYTLPEAATSRLDSLVDRIEAAPGDMIDEVEVDELARTIDIKRLLASLPPDMAQEDLTGILHLALLTECATESYAAAIGERARRFQAGWLERFNERVWKPDELTHHAPYKRILMALGFEEGGLDQRIKETQEREFVHYGGDTPVHVTVFGMVQEYLTDHWHGLIAKLLQKEAPRAAALAFRVKRRETLHTAWYRDMTALQIEAEPTYAVYLAEEVSRFRMPGNSLVPDLQGQVGRWLPLMAADFDQVVKDLLRLMHQTLGDTRRLGGLLASLAEDKGVSLGPISMRHVRTALDRLGGFGYGLVGEAALEMAGLEYLFRNETGAADGVRPNSAQHNVPRRIRALVRSWLARELEARLVPAVAGLSQARQAAIA